MRGKIQGFFCVSGLHRYAPDREAGYPYQRCRNCEKMGIYRPPRGLAVVQRLL